MTLNKNLSKFKMIQTEQKKIKLNRIIINKLKNRIYLICRKNFSKFRDSHINSIKTMINAKKQTYFNKKFQLIRKI